MSTKKKKQAKKDSGPPTLENRKARHRFEIIESIEAGIVLVGTELKSLRKGRANLSEAYATARAAELFLINLHIQPYENAGNFNHEETRSRKLLLKRAEIQHLKRKIEAKGLSLVPLKLYFNHRGRVKVLLGLGRGKKFIDKRQTEKKAQAQRDIERALRERQRA